MSRPRRSPRLNAPRPDIMTLAVKAPRIAIVVERITRLGSCAIIGRNLAGTVLLQAAKRKKAKIILALG